MLAPTSPTIYIVASFFQQPETTYNFWPCEVQKRAMTRIYHANCLLYCYDRMFVPDSDFYTTKLKTRLIFFTTATIPFTRLYRVIHIIQKYSGNEILAK